MKRILSFSLLIGLFLFHSCSKENVENSEPVFQEVTAQVLAEDALFQGMIVEWFKLHRYGIEQFHSMNEDEKQYAIDRMNDSQSLDVEFILEFYEATSELELTEDLKPMIEKREGLFKRYSSLSKLSDNQIKALFSEATSLVN
jgi:hypothetical protein